jgi:protein TonB
MATVRVKLRLAEGPDTRIMGMVGYSVAGHIVFLLLMLFLPRVIPREPPPPVLLTAQIVSLPDQQVGGAPPPEPVRSGPTPEERAEEAAREARKREAPEAPPLPDKPKPPQRNKPKPPAAKPVTKKEVAKPEPAPATPLTQGVGLGAGTPDTGSGVPSVSSASFPYQYYRTIMVNLIRSRWSRPLTPGLAEPLRCAVAFVISKNGQISNVSLSVPSDFPPLDDSAVRAVLDTNPLPPLPYQYTTSSVRAELIFELTAD